MNPPKRYTLKLPSGELQLGDRTLVMAVLNITPDSFSDGGRYSDPDRALDRALELEAAGADILDIGAESTRPGSERITEQEELHRLIPVLKKLEGKLSIPISVDTWKSAVAERALAHGAQFLNDVSNLTFDPGLAKVACNHNAVLILNHMRGTPETWAKLGSMADPMLHVFQGLEASVHRAVRAGVEKSRLVVDPGLGFGKRGAQNFELIARLHELARLDLPLLIGPSRKSFLGQSDPADADIATAAAVTAAILHGAHIVRVHNPELLLPAILTADSILRSFDPAALAAAKAEKPPVKPKDVRFAPRKLDEEARGRPIRPVLPTAEPPAPPAGPEAEEPGERPPRRVFSPRPPAGRPFRREDAGERPFRKPPSDRGFDKPFRKREEGDRPFGDKPFRKRAEGDRPFGDKPFRKPPSDRGFDKPFRKREEGDRPPRREGERPPRREGDRPPRREGDRPAWGGPAGEKPFRKTPFKKFGDKPFKKYGRDDRPPREGASEGPSGKKPFGPKKPGFGKPGFKKGPAKGGFKKSGPPKKRD